MFYEIMQNTEGLMDNFMSTMSCPLTYQTSHYLVLGAKPAFYMSSRNKPPTVGALIKGSRFIYPTPMN